MSVAAAGAVANKEDKKPLYKDYVSFLGSYKQEKKDEGDREGRCSPPTSIHSNLNDTPQKSFKECLEKYNKKIYNPIQAEFKKDQTQNGGGKMVKTEVFIEINKEQNPSRLISRTFDIDSLEKTRNHYNGVEGKNKSKALQQNIETSELQLKFNNGLGQKKNNDEDIEQQKIENKILLTKTKRHPLKKTPSITEKSKLFEKIPTNKSTGCKFGSVNKSYSVTNNGCQAPKAVFNKAMSSEITNNEKNIELKTTNDSVNLSTVSVTEIKENSSQPDILSPDRFSSASSPATTMPSCTSNHVDISCGIPPPPPPPSINFSPKKINLSHKPLSNAKTQPTIYNTMPKLQSTRPADIMDGNTAPVLDKNDPRVKKMVYGALRGMYGTYHDKANDYLATLPKNRVRKNNGLDSIINSIASQGGLEKLTGRGNPKVEPE